MIGWDGMKKNSSLRRSGRAGLWFSACGRFAVRKLGNGSWMVSPLASPDGGGPYCNWVGKQILAQRFSSKTEAAQSLDVILAMSEKEKTPVALTWERHSSGDWVAQHDGWVVFIRKPKTIWKAHALPLGLYQMMREAEEISKDTEDRELRTARFNLVLSARRGKVLLGTSRTLRQAKELSEQEFAWGESTA